MVGSPKSPFHLYMLKTVYTNHLFADLLANARADTNACELITVFPRHIYLRKSSLSYLETFFVSELVHELSKILQIRKKNHASSRDPQTVGVVERSLSAPEPIRNLNTNGRWSEWSNYISLATFIHNTSHQSVDGCRPRDFSHGREASKPLDLRFNNTLVERNSQKSESIFASQDAKNKNFLKQNSN